MLINPRDAFSSQSKNSSICWYSFLLCNSNFVPKTRRFPIFDFKKCRDLEIRVRGVIESGTVVSLVLTSDTTVPQHDTTVPFDKLRMMSY